MYRLINALMAMLLLICVSFASAAGKDERGAPGSLDELGCPDQFTMNLLPEMNPYSYIGTVEGNDCLRRDGEDEVIRVVVNGSGLYSIVDLEDGVYLYLMTECCGGSVVARGYGEDGLTCVWLDQGVYWLLLEEGEDVDYEIEFSSCDDPCLLASQALPEGEFSEGEQIRWVHTVSAATDDEDFYEGPFEGGGCQDESVNPDYDTYGFGYYSWFDQDFDWNHENAFYGEGQLEFCLEGDFQIDSAFVVICAYDVDFCQSQTPSLYFDRCENDLVWVNGENLWPYRLEGLDGGPANHSLTVTWFQVPIELLNATESSDVGVYVDIDAGSDVCTWATTLEWSKLVLYGTCRQIPEPTGFDLGDLGSPDDPDAEDCSYSTYSQPNGGPANAIYEDNVAWLGQCVSADLAPAIHDLDDCDDGVTFIRNQDDVWVPCTEVCVDVLVSTGPGYAQEPLYLWAWKDGNLDCDFVDTFCEQLPADDTQVFFPEECLIAGEPVAPGVNHLCFNDPGVLDFGLYDGYFRFRLMSAGLDVLDCFSAQYETDFVLGETEDYVVGDLQLPVELLGFSAASENGRVRLEWSTASESDNDYFVIHRRAQGGEWSEVSGHINGAGTSPSGHSYAYVDNDVIVGRSYDYRLVTVDLSGTRVVAAETEATVISGAVAVTEYKLHAAYPNPFNPSTTIAYDLRDAANVTLTVYDVLGRSVATLVNGYQQAGRYELNFEAGALPSGVYFYRIETVHFTDMKKMMLLK